MHRNMKSLLCMHETFNLQLSELWKETDVLKFKSRQLGEYLVENGVDKEAVATLSKNNASGLALTLLELISTIGDRAEYLTQYWKGTFTSDVMIFYCIGQDWSLKETISLRELFHQISLPNMARSAWTRIMTLPYTYTIAAIYPTKYRRAAYCCRFL